MSVVCRVGQLRRGAGACRDVEVIHWMVGLHAGTGIPHCIPFPMGVQSDRSVLDAFCIQRPVGSARSAVLTLRLVLITKGSFSDQTISWLQYLISHTLWLIFEFFFYMSFRLGQITTHRCDYNNLFKFITLLPQTQICLSLEDTK